MPSFEEAFPNIEEIRIEVVEMFYEKKTHYLGNDPNNRGLGEHIPYCSNRHCKEGGFELGSLLRDMYKNRETQREKLLSCTGHETLGSRWKTRPCINHFTTKISIKYKD